MSISNVGKQVMRWGTVCGLILAGVWLSGCQTQSPEQQFAEVPPGLTPSPPAATATAAPAPAPVVASAASPAVGSVVTNVGSLEPDVFRAGESMMVIYADVPGGPTPPFEGKIKEDGTVTLLLTEPFKVDGKTAGELEKEIRARYVPSKFKYMTITVKHAENTLWYYVDGEVKSPNRQIYNTRMTLLKAIASAGGFTDFAKKTKVSLTRVDGRTQTIDCNKARRKPSLDAEVYPGDKIYVPRKVW